MLKAVDPTFLFVGAKCNSVCPSDGMWYPCKIEKVFVPTQEDEEKMVETGDFRLL